MRKKRLKWMLHIVAALSLIELIFNASVLADLSERTVHWNMPDVAMANDEGVTGVIDDNWMHLTLLNPDGTVRSMISVNNFSSCSPECISDICLDDKYVYIMDEILSENGTTTMSERVLKYSLDGEYISTEYANTESSRRHQGKISTVKVFNDTLYIVNILYDSVIIVSVQNGVEKVILQCSFDGNPIQFASYQPEINAVTVSTKNGKSFLFRDGKYEQVLLSDRASHIANFVEMPDGSKYILDSDKGLLIRQEADLSESVICSTAALWVWNNAPSGTNSSLYLCDEDKGAVTRVSVPGHRISVCTSAEMSTPHIVRMSLTLTSVCIWVLIIAYFLVRYVVSVIRKYVSIKHHKEILPADDVLTPGSLYGKPALFIVFSFAVTGILFSIAFYHSRIMESKETTSNIASLISSLSRGTIGDEVRRLDSADEYENKDYRNVIRFCNEFCSGSKTEGFDLGYSLYRVDPDTGEISYIVDFHGMNILGKRVSLDNMTNQDLFHAMNAVVQGENVTFEQKSGYGMNYYFAMSPIYDSSGKITGIIYVLNNLYTISYNANEAILGILLKSITFLLVFLLILAEVNLLRDFLKIRTKRILAAGRDITICEGHRTLRILGGIPVCLLIPFISPYAGQLALQSGLEGNPGMSSALPLSLYGLMLAFGNMFMSILTKRNPKRYLQTVNILRPVMALALVFNHLYFRSFYFLVAVFIILGFLTSISISAFKAIRLFDPKPDRKYSKMVFNNMEPPIYIAIGSALGALLYDLFGFTAVLVVFVLTNLISFRLTTLFISSDINISDKTEKEKYTSKDWRETFRYFSRLDVIGCIIFVAIPFSFINAFSSFTLPMFNDNQGFPVLLVGFLTLITKLLPMSISPDIIDALKKKSSSSAFTICLTALAVGALAFAIRPTMPVFAILLFVMGVFYPVLATQIERFQINSGQLYNVAPNDVNGVFASTNYIGEFVGPIIMASLMAVGNGFVGLAFGAFCLTSIAGIVITGRKTALSCV